MDRVKYSFNENSELFLRAGKVIPGGVNSPVRSFKAVGGTPVFIKKGQGAFLYGEDKRRYVDYCMSWGALVLGHAHPRVVKAVTAAVKRGTSYGACTRGEVDLAETIAKAIPSIESVRLTSSGTEAVMGAVRLARAYTKRDKVVKFEGSYHGHADYLLAKAGADGEFAGVPLSAGVPDDFARSVLILPYNDAAKARKVFEKYGGEIAAVIVEPVMANRGVIPPEGMFLDDVRRITEEYGSLLIFDEVITGFRLSYGGAQEFFGVIPDLTCLGKIVGGGMSVGAFGGKSEVMSLLAPSGNVYQAGTLSGNPVAVAAGLTTLEILGKEDPYAELDRMAAKLCDEISALAGSCEIDIKINRVASLFSIFFDEEYPRAPRKTGCTQNTARFNEFFHGLLREGVYFSPSGQEADFLSTAHTEEVIGKTLVAVEKTFRKMKRRKK